MPRSEYYEPALLPGEKEQPQIIIDAVELYDLLVRAEMMMTKVDRIRYGNRAVAQIQDVIKEFMLAYDFEEDRRIHLKRLCANMAVFMWTVRLIGGRNIINVRDDRSGETPRPDQGEDHGESGEAGRGRDAVEEVDNEERKQGHDRHIAMIRQSLES